MLVTAASFSILFLFLLLSSSIVLVEAEDAATVVDNQEWNISQVIDLAQATLNRWNQHEIPAMTSVTSSLSEGGRGGGNDFPLLLQSLQEQLDAMDDVIQEIAALADETQTWITEQNRKTVQEFAERLETIERDEQKRRERLAQKEAWLSQKKQIQETKDNNDKQMIQFIDQLFDPRKVLKESESMLQHWILQVAQSEIEQWEAAFLAESQTKAQEEEEDEQSDPTKRKECLTVGTAVTQVQMALQEFTNDFSPFDHLANPDAAAAAGGRAIIIHEYTSPTYILPPEQRTHTLGQYQAYIPEDWIPLLPSNWKEWHIPDHIWHSLMRLSSFSTTATSSSTTSKLASLADTAPPETILQPSRYPGRCWPAANIQTHSEHHSSSSSSIAYVTIQLPYPIRVEGFTIDHVSPLLLDDPEMQLRSAPKKIRVYGYPASAKKHPTGTKNALLFDPSQTPEWLADLEYNIDANSHHGNNVQTFSILDDGDEEEIKHEDDEEDELDEEKDGKSSVGTCHSPKSCRNGAPIIAVRIEILENWGHPDYTCFYRFRVHGEKKD
jgi:hypothetical protein